jgi:O-antigen/teichoic acid export membrane protein
VASDAAKIVGTVCSRGAVALLGGVTGVVVSRALQPDGRGAYFVVVSVATTAMALGHLSVEQANVYLWSSPAIRRSLTANAAMLGCAGGAAAAAAALVVVAALGPDRVPVAGYGLLAAALLAVPPATVLLYLNGLLALDGRIGRVNLATLLAGTVQCLVLVGLAATGRLDVGAAVLVWTASMVVPLAVVLPAARIQWNAFSPGLARRALRLGLRYHLGMATLYLLLRVDVFLLNAQVSTAQVGVYSLAVTLAELVHLPANAVAQVVLPRQIRDELAPAGRFTAEAARRCCLMAAAGVAGMVVVGPWLVPAVFGSAFGGCVPALAALGPGVVALATIRPVGGFLVRLNRPLLMSGAIGAVTAVNVALNLLLIPDLGIVGAGLASSVAYLLLAVCYGTWMCRSARLEATALLPRSGDLRPVLVWLGRHRRTRPAGRRPYGPEPLDAAMTAERRRS